MGARIIKGPPERKENVVKTLVLYHGNCPDGFTAAWAAWRALGDQAEYRAVNYGHPPPDDAKGRRVVLVDFSYPRAALDALADVAASVEVYDHHKTAQADLTGWGRGMVVFDMERSGAGIVWDEFHPREHRPALVSYVEDRDLWRWRLTSSREVSEYVFSWPYSFENWDLLASHLGAFGTRGGVAFQTVVECGSAMLRAKHARVAKVCENARWLIFSGGDGDQVALPVVNTSWDFSEIGEYLCEQFPDAPAGGYYFDRVDARQWGFRSRDDFDVSALCKRYGGGGHKNAAGFTSEIGWLP